MTTSPRKITIDPPSEMTVLAARHLDATEGPVQVGSTVDTSARSAITTVLRYIATAHNSPAAAVPVAAPPVAVDSSEDRCAECGHFRGAHEEAEEPVSVGRCTVCADEDEWHDFEAVEESPVAAPPTTEQGDLRDRIRRAVCEAEGFGFAWGTDMLEPDEYGEVADMVLAVLFGPIPAGTDVATWTAIRAIQLMNEAGQQRDAVLPAPADRAATLREAATRYEEILANADTGQDPRYWTAVRDVTLGLRAMAVEAGQASEDQPETPLEKRLRYSERRNDELRTECKRRGKTVLEQAEKIVALERQIDEVRSQLGAEILRAGQAEAELRRLADEEQAGGPSREATEWLAAAKFVEAMNEGCDNRRPCESCTTREDVAAELRRGAAEPQPETQTDEEPIAGAQQCGHDDYHDPHQWADRPEVWCPGWSFADDVPAVSSRPGTEQEA